MLVRDEDKPTTTNDIEPKHELHESTTIIVSSDHPTNEQEFEAMKENPPEGTNFAIEETATVSPDSDVTPTSAQEEKQIIQKDYLETREEIISERKRDNETLDAMGLGDAYGDTYTKDGNIFATSLRTGRDVDIGDDRSGKPTASYDDASVFGSYGYAESETGVRVKNDQGVFVDAVLEDGEWTPSNKPTLEAPTVSERTEYDPFQINMSGTDNYGKAITYPAWVLDEDIKTVVEPGNYNTEKSVTEHGKSLDWLGGYDPKRGVFVIAVGGKYQAGTTGELHEVLGLSNQDFDWQFGQEYTIDQLAERAISPVNKKTIVDVTFKKDDGYEVMSFDKGEMSKNMAGMGESFNNFVKNNTASKPTTDDTSNIYKNTIMDTFNGKADWYDKNIAPTVNKVLIGSVPPLMIADSLGINILPGWITGDVAALPSNTLRFMGMGAEALQISGNTMISENKRLRSTYKTDYIGLNIATVKSNIGMVTGAIGRGAPMLADQFNTDPARFSYNMVIGALAGKAIGSGAGTVRPYMGMAVKRTGSKTILETAKTEPIREIKLTGELKLDMGNSNDPISNVGYNPLQEPIYEGMSTESGYIIRLGKKSMPPSRLQQSRVNVNTRSGFELLDKASKPTIKTVSVGKTIYSYKSGLAEGILSTGISGISTKQNTKTTSKVDSILNFKMPTTTKVKSSTVNIPAVTTMRKTKQKQKPDTILNFKYSQSSKPHKNVFDNSEIPSGNRMKGGRFFKLGSGAGGASKGSFFKMSDAHTWKNPGILSDMIGDFSFNSKRKNKKGKKVRK